MSALGTCNSEEECSYTAPCDWMAAVRRMAAHPVHAAPGGQRVVVASWLKALGGEDDGAKAAALGGILHHITMHGVVPAAVLQRVFEVSSLLAWWH